MQPERILITLLVVAGAAAGSVAASPRHSPAPAHANDAALIRSAVSAAPRKVGETATVVVAEADGSMRTLRAGSGFTCMPDNPTTPGPDPMCMDEPAMAWAHAWMTHATPPAGRVGFIYMLEGGTDASNTDPYAKGPTSANHWVKTGPHVMVVGADDAFYAAYPRGASPDTAVPYVMWAGTPYQHVMIPVR